MIEYCHHSTLEPAEIRTFGLMDTHVFASLAQIRILLVPIGTISQQTFEKYASEIRTFDAIRLADVAVEGNRDERGT